MTGPTRSGAIVGTPAYMAPEQAAGDGRDIGPAVDVHALGAILYELLTGRPPFQGVTVLETLEHVRTRDPLPPSRFAPALPRDLETICMKCLEKEPGRRYASAAVLADELGRFQRGEPILARPTPTWEKTWKWARRRPAVAALLVTLIALTMVALSSVTVLWRQTAAALVAMQEERDNKEAALASNLIALAERDWLANDLDAARRHLDECPPDRRSPKWRQLHRVCHAELFLLGSRPVSRGTESAGNVAAVAWSPDGRLVAADYLGGAVHVWDLETGGERFALHAAVHKLNRLAFDPDGNLVTMTWRPNLLGFSPKSATRVELKNWDVRIGRETASDSKELLMAQSQGVLSGNGRRFVAVQGGKVSILDIRGQLLVASMVRDLPLQIHKMTLSIDGRMLAWWAGESKAVVRVWDTTTWTMADIPATTISSLAFSPDGTRLATGRYDRDTNTGFASVWDYRNRREIVALRGHSSAVTCMAFSPDGRRLATSADQTVSIWDLDTGKELFTFRGHRAPVSALAFRFDGKRLASGGNDATVRIWDVTSGDERLD